MFWEGRCWKWDGDGVLLWNREITPTKIGLKPRERFRHRAVSIIDGDNSE
jgi:hypothetical protein